MLFMHGPSVVTCFQCFVELCVSAFSVVTANRLRAALIDMHKHKYYVSEHNHLAKQRSLFFFFCNK